MVAVRRSYAIAFAEAAVTHLAALTARERSTVIDAIKDQLSHEPLTESRNRKFLRPNRIASWELRVGALRVFYDVAPTDQAAGEPSLVRILGVGRTMRDVLRIGEENVEL